MAAMGVQPGYTMEQNPRSSKALGEWVEEIVPRGQVQDRYVKFGGLLKYQLHLHAWLNDNTIPGTRLPTIYKLSICMSFKSTLSLRQIIIL